MLAAGPVPTGASGHSSAPVGIGRAVLVPPGRLERPTRGLQDCRQWHSYRFEAKGNARGAKRGQIVLIGAYRRPVSGGTPQLRNYSRYVQVSIRSLA